MFLLKWLELRYIILDHAFEIYAGSIALLFTILGIWIAGKLAKPRPAPTTISVSIPPAPSIPVFIPDEKEQLRLGLSERELEVLRLMSEGLSNQEIAGKLYLSLNTIKTHSSRLFFKLDVNRRTQAIDKAKRLNLIP
jgi:DNA-binding NarL/FixJ family response regulator